MNQGDNAQLNEHLFSGHNQFNQQQMNFQNYNQFIQPVVNEDPSQQEHMKKLKEKLIEIREDINKMPKDPEVFKNHQLPLARVKKIMKSDEDVRMISAEAPVLFAKACELFIIELTHRAWQYTEEGKRRTLQKSDIAACIYNTEIFDFLMDIIPKEEMKQQMQVKKPMPNEGYFGNINAQFIREFQQLQQQQAQLNNPSRPQQQQQQQQQQQSGAMIPGINLGQFMNQMK